MSIIAVRKVNGQFEIAADSIDVWNGTFRKSGEAKLWRVTPHLAVGSAGHSSIGTLMRVFIKHKLPRKNTLDGWLEFAKSFRDHIKPYELKMEDNSFLLVYRNTAWMLNGLHVSRVRRHEAVGAGRAYALAALHLGYSAREACEVACDHCIHCARPVKVLKVR